MQNTSLIFSYDGKTNPDGAGSQMHRVLALYCMSEFFRVDYRSLRLQSIEYQGMNAFSSQSRINSLVEKYNCLMDIPDHVSLVSDATSVVDIEHLDERGLRTCWDISKARGESVIVNVTYPFRIADRIPDLYKKMKGRFGLKAHDRLTETFPDLPGCHSFFREPGDNIIKIGVHVRRGEILATAPGRLIPESKYVNIMIQLEQVFRQAAMPIQFIIFSELITSPVRISPDTRLLGPMMKETFTSNGEVLEDVFPEISHRFDVIWRINTDPLVTLNELCECDVMIGSRSSFSYVAACCGKAKDVFMPTFWHPKQPGWKDF